MIFCPWQYNVPRPTICQHPSSWTPVVFSIRLFQASKSAVKLQYIRLVLMPYPIPWSLDKQDFVLSIFFNKIQIIKHQNLIVYRGSPHFVTSQFVIPATLWFCFRPQFCEFLSISWFWRKKSKKKFSFGNFFCFCFLNSYL